MKLFVFWEDKMDIFLILGLGAGVFTLVVGMIVKGADVTVLLNPAAMIIIFVGTFATIMNSYPKKEFINIIKLFGVLFSDKGHEDPADIIKQMVQMAQETRRNGLLSLEKTAQNIDNKFMKKGLEMVVDGMEPQTISEVLTIEIESMEERHKAGAGVFSTAGGASPTLGVLGAVIGLIGALGDLNDVERLGHMICAAFVATLFGIFFGYVVWHPFASRLKRKSAEEVLNMNIIFEGLLGIQAGNNPKIIERKLVGMLPPKERAKIETANEGE